MYKKSYVCDCCGDVMTSPMYTLELSTNDLCMQDQTAWHYCGDCWRYVKKTLTKKNESNDLEKAVEELREENRKLKKDAAWYEQFFISIFNAFLNSIFCKQTGYGFTTASSNKEETIQSKLTDDGPFSVGCCCDDAYKDSLDYKQTVGMI